MSHLFKDAAHSQQYAKFRPKYPTELYETVVSYLQCKNTDLALDVGCGSGQATVPLAQYFRRVIGVDPSESQISEAQAHERVTYVIGSETKLPAKAENVAAVTVAQAAHYFELENFYKEVDRVLLPGGVMAIWTYCVAEFESEYLHKVVIEDFYDGLLKRGGYWDERKDLADNRYRDIPRISDSAFQNHRIETGLDVRQKMTLDELLGYLRSWSGYATYCKRNNVSAGTPGDPVEDLRKTLIGSEHVSKGIAVTFPITLLMSVKKGGTAENTS